MTPEQLKASIIFDALQGKIVEQKKDELSPDLSNIKCKKTEEIGFDIPKSWGVAHLESISNSIASKQYQIVASEFKGEGKYPIVSQSKEYVIGYSDDKTKLYHHVNPVIVFGDHTAIVKYVDFDFIVGADGVKIIDPDTSIITAKFLQYVLEFYSTGIEKVGGYSRHYKFIKDKPVPIPPLEEQHRIVAKIEELLPYVDRYAEAYEKLEQFNAKFPEDMKKSILQYAIQGKLVEQRPEEGTAEELYQKIQAEKQKLIKEGKIKKEKPIPEITADEIPFDIPESWKWVRLSSLCKSITDGDHQAPPQTSEGYPFVVISNISEGKLDFSHTRHVGKEYFKSLSSDRIAEKGDLLFSVTGSYGIVIKIDTDTKFCFQRHIALIKLIMCQEYLFYILQTPFVKGRCDELSTGIAQKTVGLSTLRNMLIPLPPLEEQHRIVAKIEELLPYCDRLKKE